MDNLTHSLAGAILGQMGLKTKTGLAMPTLIIAANIPDIDAVAVLLGGHQHLALRRGLTHGPIAMVLLPVLLWAAMLAWDKWRPSEKRLPVHKGWLLALAYIGTLSHPALDWLNNYGVRLLEPFSSQWFYGDSIFIIDLWIWAALIAGVWISLRREKRGNTNWRRPAVLGFFAVCSYIFANGMITGQAESMARDQIIARYDPTASMLEPEVVANPVPIAFWQREIVWRDEQDYGSGSYSLGTGPVLLGEVRPHNMGQGAASRTMPFRVVADPGSDAAAFLFWSRMPVLEQQDDALIIRDQRFMDPRIGDRFLLRIPVPTEIPAR
ncbi:MAG: metal-dependent hydrolase [Sphingorhabdus sp.]